MKEAEVALLFEQFKKEAQALEPEALLDAWIAHCDKREVVPDLDLLKSGCLEVLLQQKFGWDYYKVVEQRRKDSSNA